MPLAKYVQQLLDDLNAAKSRVPEVPKCLYEEPMPGLWYIAEWENAPSKPLSEWVGIPGNVFPPADRLTADELQKLAHAMFDLWVTFNFIPLLPENLPPVYVYQTLSRNWNIELQYISEGTGSVELCNYDRLAVHTRLNIANCATNA